MAGEAQGETPAADRTDDATPVADRTDEELRLGDLVVLMAEPGPFTVVEIDPPVLTIESRFGQRRRVRDVAVRRVSGEPPIGR